ncbi:glycosyltransferase [Tieghemostelium lacteum]|uniref:Fucosyltransferase n=1 Tax=Tieghemostelium lacteum TaxID=361077 RepID=A0A152A3F9_TIELA|nr:glycosyltransferase [Tieghemostelium lacteum]|eukprot:KYR00802.1 glycosyltransferase [Tieghemostelium lacteum]
MIFQVSLNRKNFFVVLSVVLLLYFLVLLYVNLSKLDTLSPALLAVKQQPPKDEIIFIGGQFMHTDYLKTPIQIMQCSYQGKEYNVTITTDKELLKDANMVLYFDDGPDTFNPVPPVKDKINMVCLSESIYNTHCLGEKECANRFNWTISLPKDSDIRIHYFMNSLRLLPVGDSFDFQRDVMETKIKAKREENVGLASWFTSYCATEGSNRIHYMESLMKYIKVDSYGECLNNIELQGEQRFNTTKKFLEIAKRKFYFSFENSMCPEYLSEKAYQCLNSNVVPVIMAHPSATKLLPTGSYIYVGDFSSSKELADYLVYLDQNDEMYKKYFAYRKDKKNYEQWIKTFSDKHMYCDIFTHFQEWKLTPNNYISTIQPYNKSIECLDPNGLFKI